MLVPHFLGKRTFCRQGVSTPAYGAKMTFENQLRSPAFLMPGLPKNVQLPLFKIEFTQCIDNQTKDVGQVKIWKLASKSCLVRN